MEEIRLNCPQCHSNYITALADIVNPHAEFDCIGCGVRFAFDLDPSLNFKETQTYIVTDKTMFNAADFKVVSSETISENARNLGENLPDFTLEDSTQAVKASPDLKKPTDPLSNEVKTKLPESPALLTSVAPTTPLLQSLWQEVRDDYDNLERHRKFLDAAIEHRKLPFAAQQYKGILTVSPTDEVAAEMSEKIKGIATQILKRPSLHQLHSDVDDARGTIFYLFVFIGLLLIVTGVLLPDVRQVIGAGAAVLVLAFGFRFLAKQPES